MAKHLQGQQLDASLTTDKRMRAQLITIAASRAESEIKRILLASGRSFMSLFHGLQILWAKRIESAQQHYGAVTFTFIEAFNTLLSTVTSVCELIAKQEVAVSLADNPPASESKPLKTQKMKKAEAAPIPYHVAMFIRMLLGSLTRAREGAHTALFEGILYYLLDRTGKCLFTTTFDHERTASVAADIDPIPLTALKIKAVRIETKLLVELLECAMSLAPAFLGSLSTPTASTKKTPARQGTISSKAPSYSKAISQSKSTISIAAKEKLQATLIYCMYGEEVRDNFENDGTEEDEDEDGELTGARNGFLERLKKPLPLPPVVQPPKVEDEDVPRWFREEVWRLVGWDLLGRVGDW
jgi:hypothetical protein